jgi:TetR/AcrR family transcriptional regulator, regulator of cefoperazone and chloramphenicol sensitivity
MNTDKKKQNLSRKKIINSAIVLFANKGFDSTSTREICKHAGVNLSLIPYYFGNKDGLYTNIIESIINYGLAYMQDELTKASDIKELCIDEKIAIYKSVLDKYAEFIYSENVPDSFIVLMVKEQAVAHSKFSDIYSQKISFLYKTLRRLLASILGKKETDKAIIFEVSSIIGQILSFKFMDRATLSAFNQDFYTKDDNRKIKNIILGYIKDSIKRIEEALKVKL